MIDLLNINDECQICGICSHQIKINYELSKSYLHEFFHHKSQTSYWFENHDKSTFAYLELNEDKCFIEFYKDIIFYDSLFVIDFTDSIELLKFKNTEELFDFFNKFKQKFLDNSIFE